MSNNPLIPESKLPALGTTIFTQMSALAQQHQAINLSQGFPDFDGPRYLQERLAYHVAQGANQYAPMTGVPALREAIAQLTDREQMVIRLRYFHGLTQDKTAKILGVSQVQISRIEKKALAALRQHI